jgi:hypothetical protein
MNSEFGKTRLDNEAIEADWRERLSNDVCLAWTSRPETYDLVLRQGSFIEPMIEGSWRPWFPGHIRISRKLF